MQLQFGHESNLYSPPLRMNGFWLVSVWHKFNFIHFYLLVMNRFVLYKLFFVIRRDSDNRKALLQHPADRVLQQPLSDLLSEGDGSHAVLLLLHHQVLQRRVQVRSLRGLQLIVTMLQCAIVLLNYRYNSASKYVEMGLFHF